MSVDWRVQPSRKLRNKRNSKILRQIFCSKVRQLTIIDIKFNFFNIKQIIALIFYFYGLIFMGKNLKTRNFFIKYKSHTQNIDPVPENLVNKWSAMPQHSVYLIG